MGNVLILTEKKTIAEKIKDALTGIECMSIGGHAYTLDEKDVLNVSKDAINSSFHTNYREPVYILNPETIASNCNEILNFLKKSDVEFIVNACDFDKNGDYLFKYAVEDMMKLDSSKYVFKRMELFNISQESIVSAYNAAMELESSLEER